MAIRQLGFSPLEKALYTRLKTSSYTSGYNIYTYIPDNASLPYIRIGDYIGIPSTNFNNRDYPNEDNTALIHVWSDYHGNKECVEMMEDVIQAIDALDLSITGYSTPFSAVLEMADVVIDDSEPGELKRHGTIRFRFSMGASS